ncbi:MAG: hypothetical protein JWO95_1835, partial [Verrucomicrobiales bacterium]|nr:hypothetical protein [Verrucomicrobiales bacterium]
MKNFKLLGLAVVLSCSICCANAESDIEQLKAQMRQMQENFERVQREQRQQIEALTQKIESLSHQPSSTNAAVALIAGTNAPTAKTDEQKKLEAELAAELGPQTNAPAPA